MFWNLGIKLKRYFRKQINIYWQYTIFTIVLQCQSTIKVKVNIIHQVIVHKRLPSKDTEKGKNQICTHKLVSNIKSRLYL